MSAVLVGVGIVLVDIILSRLENFEGRNTTKPHKVFRALSLLYVIGIVLF